MKGKIKIIILVIVLLIAVAAAILLGTGTKTIKTAEVTIEEGSDTMEIAHTLKKSGVIRSEAAFLVRLKTSSYAGKLRYGTYEIKKGTSMNRLFQMLATEGAKKNTINLTVPEGYSAEQIGDELQKQGVCKKDEFLKAVDTKGNYDFKWLAKIKEDKNREHVLQGYLYPDTYNIYKTATPKEIVTVMLENFEKHYSQLDAWDRLDQIVTEASVIERETGVDSERATIAGVIENRMAKKMRLQVDATVLYPLTNGMYDKKSVTYKDLKVDSPYNTYLNKGLPVGPICNPSIESMEAAANPQKHKYLYYHTKSKDSKEHNFYKTYEEHIKSQKKE